MRSSANCGYDAKARRKTKRRIVAAGISLLFSLASVYAHAGGMTRELNPRKGPYVAGGHIEATVMLQVMLQVMVQVRVQAIAPPTVQEDITLT